MTKRQIILSWCKTNPKKIAREECSSSRDINTDSEDNVNSYEPLDVETESEEPHYKNLTQESQTLYAGDSRPEVDSVVPECSTCTALCCMNFDQAFQPEDKQTLQKLANKNGNFQLQWYKKFPWLSVCVARKKVFCLYCQYGTQHNLITFSKLGEKAFTETGFQNWRKAMDKFKYHEGSHVHREAQMK